MKNTVGELLGDTVAMVDDGYTDGLAVVDSSRADTNSLLPMKSAAHRIQGIAGQIEEYLLKLDRISHYGREFRRILGCHSYSLRSRVRFDEVQDFIHDLVDILTILANLLFADEAP